jgi:hypothetical protein
VASDPALDVELTSTTGQTHPLAAWLTNFPLALVVVDPYTLESSWILDTAVRLFDFFRAADCRVAWLSTASSDDTKRFLGPLADTNLAFADADRALVKSLELATVPAFVAIRQDGSLLGACEGWDPHEWRALADKLSKLTGWTKVVLPAKGDPSAYPGTAA